MVRLEVDGKQSEVGISKFQFHYGTIRRVDEYQSEDYLSHFNSTMVRLEDS